MNKRLTKKTRKKKQAFEGFLFAEGNNGGDFIKVENLEYGLIHLSAGSSCVMIMDKVVPIEFLTGILRQKMMEHNGDINSIIDSLGWDKNFTNELRMRVRDAY